MASRKLFWSLLRSPLTRSPPMFHLPTYLRPLCFSNLTSPAIDFSQTNAFLRVESGNGLTRLPSVQHGSMLVPHFQTRFMSTETSSVDSSSQGSSLSEPEVPRPIKFKRLDKTARHIMQILDKEAVEEVKGQREMPDIKPEGRSHVLSEPSEKKRAKTPENRIFPRKYIHGVQLRAGYRECAYMAHFHPGANCHVPMISPFSLTAPAGRMAAPAGRMAAPAAFTNHFPLRRS